MRKSELVILLIVVVSFLIGVCLYPQMPERMASHWNARGEVDGYMSKFWGLFLMPLISVAAFLLFVLVPRIDPLKANIEKFRKYFDIFIVLVILFFFYLYLLTVFWNLGIRLNLPQFLAPAFGVLLYYAGVLIENAKRNYFIGIRTPWTLSSDAVWDKTHQIRRPALQNRRAHRPFGHILPPAGDITYSGPGDFICRLYGYLLLF